MRIFFKEFDEKIDTKKAEKDLLKTLENNSNPNSNLTKSTKQSFAYNKFNDPNFVMDDKELKTIVGKDQVTVETKRKIRYHDEDPLLKHELNKYNYRDMMDLNRDFQFYINHPDKIARIQRLKKKLNKPKSNRPQQISNTYSNDFPDKENMMKYNGVSRHSKGIKRISEMSRFDEKMNIDDRKALLKTLF